MTKQITVLKGGWSSEREVSLTSGAAVEKALAELGYQVSSIDVQPDIAVVLSEKKPPLVFNALHGRFGEDGCVQGMLEMLNIPYTHSGVLASALAMSKPAAKRIFQSVGIRTPESAILTISDILERPPFNMPFVVKPPNDGSSVGVKIIQTEEDLKILRKEHPERRMLVEPFIKGREIQVAVLDGEPLGAIEIRPKSGFYDYEAKYTAGKADHIMPAPIPDGDYKEVLSLAAKAHVALGCRGLTRSDFRYDDKDLGPGMFYILETNTQPGMTPLSLAPEIAAHVGISFNELVKRLVEGARLGD